MSKLKIKSFSVTYELNNQSKTKYEVINAQNKGAAIKQLKNQFGSSFKLINIEQI